MSRSVKKGPFIQEALLKRVQEMNKTGDKKVLKTWSRASTVFPELVAVEHHLPGFHWPYGCRP